MLVVQVQSYYVVVDIRRGVRCRHGGIRAMAYDREGLLPLCKILVQKSRRELALPSTPGELLDLQVVRTDERRGCLLDQCCVLFRDPDGQGGWCYEFGQLFLEDARQSTTVSPGTGFPSALRFASLARWSSLVADDDGCRFRIVNGPSVCREAAAAGGVARLGAADSSGRASLWDTDAYAALVTSVVGMDCGEPVFLTRSGADPDSRAAERPVVPTVRSSFYELEKATVASLVRGKAGSPSVSRPQMMGPRVVNSSGAPIMSVPCSVAERTRLLVPVRESAHLVLTRDNQLLAIDQGAVISVGSCSDCVLDVCVAATGPGDQLHVASVERRDGMFVCCVRDWPSLRAISRRSLRNDAGLPGLVAVRSWTASLYESFMVYFSPMSKQPGTPPLKTALLIGGGADGRIGLDFHDRDNGHLASGARSSAGHEQFVAVLQRKIDRLVQETDRVEERSQLKLKLARCIVSSDRGSLGQEIVGDSDGRDDSDDVGDSELGDDEEPCDNSNDNEAPSSEPSGLESIVAKFVRVIGGDLELEEEDARVSSGSTGPRRPRSRRQRRALAPSVQSVRVLESNNVLVSRVAVQLAKNERHCDPTTSSMPSLPCGGGDDDGGPELATSRATGCMLLSSQPEFGSLNWPGGSEAGLADERPIASESTLLPSMVLETRSTDPMHVAGAGDSTQPLLGVLFGQSCPRLAEPPINCLLGTCGHERWGRLFRTTSGGEGSGDDDNGDNDDGAGDVHFALIGEAPLAADDLAQLVREAFPAWSVTPLSVGELHAPRFRFSGQPASFGVRAQPPYSQSVALVLSGGAESTTTLSLGAVRGTAGRLGEARALLAQVHRTALQRYRGRLRVAADCVSDAAVDLMDRTLQAYECELEAWTRLSHGMYNGTKETQYADLQHAALDAVATTDYYRSLLPV